MFPQDQLEQDQVLQSNTDSGLNLHPRISLIAYTLGNTTSLAHREPKESTQRDGWFGQPPLLFFIKPLNLRGKMVRVEIRASGAHEPLMR